MLRSLVGSEMCIRDRYSTRIDDQVSQLINVIPPLPIRESHKTQRRFLQSQGNHTQKERLSEVLYQNNIIDNSPSHSSQFKLRPRVKSKEIQEPFYMRPKTDQERLKDTQQYHQQLYGCSNTNKVFLLGGKSIRGYYHFRTNFKTIEHNSLMKKGKTIDRLKYRICLLYTSPSPRDS